MTVYLYTDGACRGNPGPGGWGVLLRYRNQEKRLFGGEKDTTNNRMELMAVIKGLQALKRSCDVVVVTDSQYVQRGMLEWLVQWQQNGWKTADKKPVKNVDLWQQLQAEVARHRAVKWEWVRGHSQHPENEIADELARKGIDH